MRIVRENTVGLVIDIQQKLYARMPDKESLLKNSLTLLRGLKALNIPVLFTQQYSRGLGDTVSELTREYAGSSFDPIEKISFSCCGEPDFSERLRKTGKKNIIIAGIETHVCVLQTGIDLINEGYQPVIVEDCVSSRRKTDKQVALRRLLYEGAIISTFESVLFELLQKAGTEEFKTISKLVK